MKATCAWFEYSILGLLPLSPSLYLSLKTNLSTKTSSWGITQQALASIRTFVVPTYNKTHLWWVDLAGHHKPTQPSSAGQEENKEREITHQLLSQIKQTHLGKMNVLPIKNRMGYWETKTKVKPSFPHPPFFPGLSSLLHPQLLFVLLPDQCRRWEMVAEVNPYQVLSAIPSSSLLIQSGSSSWAAVLHELLQLWLFAWAVAPSG